MPRTVDHEERRAQLAEALVRVAARDGLHAVTMRAVAAESGVSLRLVQYYFDTKEELLLGALRHLERRSRQRWAARLAGLPDPVPPRDFVEAFLAEALPSDEESRVFHLVGASYAVLAMTEPRLSAEPFASSVDELHRQLADALRRAQDDGQLAGDVVDVSLEAARLVTLSHGLGTSVLIGHQDVDGATAVLRYHVDTLFSARDRETAGR
ncbi:TetR/AcrR family transcriptional regulator [Amycolatopsis keratiniphila]|uniref:TetR/AcrR family transcriptional regulator n=1 Tax=Amycolatopsis keratiniphila TaxID=129921 RepID=UPI00087C24E9|nr:TetR/AcrR family transcriptional regulator [Amycolatopsis keratiniphila]OLZ58499.1 TetR family transcriptional regulator [Amycolatopsis keratiniphila subsp. nogabecina]SDU00564.1 regulatory protein, tetR family [Amycolatopsis keratiniphila]